MSIEVITVEILQHSCNGGPATRGWPRSDEGYLSWDGVGPHAMPTCRYCNERLAQTVAEARDMAR